MIASDSTIEGPEYTWTSTMDIAKPMQRSGEIVMQNSDGVQALAPSQQEPSHL